MSKRVLITGVGVLSALGRGIDRTCDALRNEESGIGEVTYLATEHHEFPVGEVKFGNAEMAGELGVGFPESELRTVLLGALALREAVGSASLSDADIRGAAFVNGTTVGGMDLTERLFKEVYESEGASESTVNLEYNYCGITTELTARHAGKFAFVTTSSTACSSGANAIILGAEMIKAGLYDIVVAGGAESLSKFHLNGFNTLMILSQERCRPFDRDRNGINLGEGAAYLVLESEESARRRGATPLAELSGYGNACDAFHQTATSDNGEGAYRAMSEALASAGLNPEDIGYVNAHGTGTPNNDICELAAMRRIWGNNLPRFSSTKSLTGHTTSASGAIEAAISILTLRKGLIPANAGFSNPIEAGAEPVKETIHDAEVRHVVDNSFGFGGNDSSLIFSRYDD